MGCILPAIVHPRLVGVFIENYSFGSTGNVFQIAENTGSIKSKLYKAGFDIHVIPPTVVKKHATGHGAAKKEGMYEAFVKRTGVELMKMYQPKAKNVGSPVGDLVDAFFIAMCGWDGIGLNTAGDPNEE
jgi:Holliday junction resolvasome RuvABC endonuclease subunit